VPDSPKSFAEHCEQVLVEVLEPCPAQAERIMRQLEEWLERRSPAGVPLYSSQLDSARGEQLVSDLAPGMLTEELLGDLDSKG
jgi:hypothetical protein